MFIFHIHILACVSAAKDAFTRHDSFIYNTGLVRIRAALRRQVDSVEDDAQYDTIHTRVMTYSYMRHDSFIYETRLIHICDTTRSYMRHDSFICAT